ncbi:MAG: helix-turn-helix domain-containing protein [Armatimonadota bacterium]|nr:helix-turn-helix domain-containing protein [Armatimonadota bacterium]
MKRQAELARLVSAFADAMRARRKALGFTQEELAERSDFSTNYIARLELGASIPSLSALTRLSRALRVRAPDLLANELKPLSSSDVCATLMMPLNEHEAEYVLAQLRNTVDFVLSMRGMEQGNKHSTDD